MRKSTSVAIVASIRRQFLLNVHPDRFHDKAIRRKQTKLMKQFNLWSENVGFDKFISEKGNGFGFNKGNHFSGGTRKTDEISKFYIENKMGDLMQCSIEWGTVGEVVKSMVDVLSHTDSNFNDRDIVSYIESLQQSSVTGESQIFPEGIHWMNSKIDNGTETHNVSEKYNRRSNFGRNLDSFLSKLNVDEMKHQRNLRIDASNAARTVKETYQFEAVDASRLQWSSENLRKVFVSLNNMFQEHKSKLRLGSFYPLRLVLSSDDHQDRFCEYSSEILINPAATPLQWLRVFMQIEESLLIRAKSKRKLITTWTRSIENTLPIKIRKGPSCSPADYYYCLQRINNELENRKLSYLSTESSTALSRSDTVYISFEASGSYRRPQVGSDGVIRVGADTDTTSFIAAWKRLQDSSSQKRLNEEMIMLECREKIKLLQSSLDVLFVRKEQRSSVTSSQVLDCLNRLITRITKEEDDLLYKRLSKNSLRIGPTGQVCRLGNDGSIIIPWNWQ